MSIEQLNGHDIVFSHTDDAGTTWLGTSLDDLLDNFAIDGEHVKVHVLGDDCTVAYWASKEDGQ